MGMKSSRPANFSRPEPVRIPMGRQPVPMTPIPMPVKRIEYRAGLRGRLIGTVILAVTTETPDNCQGCGANKVRSNGTCDYCGRER